MHFKTGTLRNNLMMTLLMEPSISMKEIKKGLGDFCGVHPYLTLQK